MFGALWWPFLWAWWSRMDRRYPEDLTGLVWYSGVDKEFDYEVTKPARYRIMAAYSAGMIAFCGALGTGFR